MARKLKEYQRLPGRKKGFLVGKYTLYLGVDHLLLVFGRLGVEDYKRFYFSDIQAIITRKTAAGKISNLILGIFFLGFVGLGFSIGEGGLILFALVDGFLLMLLVINLLAGPTCQTHLLTAVQTEKLPSIHRLRNAIRTMDRLRPLINQTQGNLKPEDIKAKPVRQLSSGTGANAAVAKSSGLRGSKYEKGHMHGVLFALALFNGLLAVCGFFFDHVVLTLIGSLTGILMGIVGVIAVVRQQGGSLNPHLRMLSWATLGFVGATFIAGYIVSMIMAFRHPGMMYNQWELIKLISSLSPRESSLILSLHLFALGGALFLGIPGLVLLKRFRRNVPRGKKSLSPSTPAGSRRTITPRTSACRN